MNDGPGQGQRAPRTLRNGQQGVEGDAILPQGLLQLDLFETLASPGGFHTEEGQHVDVLTLVRAVRLGHQFAQPGQIDLQTALLTDQDSLEIEQLAHLGSGLGQSSPVFGPELLSGGTGNRDSPAIPREQREGQADAETNRVVAAGIMGARDAHAQRRKLGEDLGPDPGLLSGVSALQGQQIGTPVRKGCQQSTRSSGVHRSRSRRRCTVLELVVQHEDDI